MTFLKVQSWMTGSASNPLPNHKRRRNAAPKRSTVVMERQLFQAARSGFAHGVLHSLVASFRAFTGQGQAPSSASVPRGQPVDKSASRPDRRAIADCRSWTDSVPSAHGCRGLLVAVVAHAVRL